MGRRHGSGRSLMLMGFLNRFHHCFSVFGGGVYPYGYWRFLWLEYSFPSWNFCVFTPAEFGKSSCDSGCWLELELVAPVSLLFTFFAGFHRLASQNGNLVWAVGVEKDQWYFTIWLMAWLFRNLIGCSFVCEQSCYCYCVWVIVYYAFLSLTFSLCILNHQILQCT